MDVRECCGRHGDINYWRKSEEMIAKVKNILVVALIVMFIFGIVHSKQREKQELQEENLGMKQDEMVMGQQEFPEEIDISEMDFREYDESYGTEFGQHEFTLEEASSAYFEGNVSIHSKEEAIEIGRGIIRAYHKAGIWTDFTLVNVSHYTADNVWRFAYSRDQRDVPVEKLYDCGGAFYVVDGDSGEILDAWVTE